MWRRDQKNSYASGDWNHGILWLSHHIGNVIIPTDELIFFRGVGQPPTCTNVVSSGSYVSWSQPICQWTGKALVPSFCQMIFSQTRLGRVQYTPLFRPPNSMFFSRIQMLEQAGEGIAKNDWRWWSLKASYSGCSNSKKDGKVNSD